MAYSDDILALSPVHYWRLNGDALDIGTGVTLNGGGTGVNFAGPALHPGNTASAEFGRESDDIAIATSADLEDLVRTQFTCSMVVRPTLDTLPFLLFQTGGTTNGISMFLAAGMVPAISVTNSSTTVTVFADRPLIINEAANVVFRYNAGTVDIFIDGRNVASVDTAPTSVGATASGSDIGGDNSVSTTVPIPGGTFTIYTLSGQLSDLATWNSLLSDAVVFDTLFAGSAVAKTAQIELTGIPDVTEIRFFDLDDSLAEVAGIETVTPSQDLTLSYSVTTELRTRLAILNVDERFNPFYADDVILPREGASFPVDLLLEQDRVYSGDFVTPIAPTVLTTPSISGTASVGSTITLDDPGTYSGRPTPTITRQWRRNGVDIPGETGATYLLVPADDGTVITCAVTATNSAGSVTAVSNVISLLASGFVGIYRHTGGDIVGATATVLDFDTEVRNDLSTYSKTGAAFDLPVGRYLAAYQACWIASGQNNRGQVCIEARKNGVLIPGSRGSGYQRDTANDAAWASGAAIIDSDGSDQFDARIFRDAGASVGGLDALRTSMFLVSIDASTDIGRYAVSSSGAFGAQTYGDLDFTTLEEVGTSIARTGSVISLAPGKYAIVGGAWFSGTTSRTSRFTRLTLDGNHLAGSSGYAYGRDSSNEFMGPNSMAFVEVTGSALDLKMQARGPGPGGTTVDGGAVLVGADSSLTVARLNSGAEFYAAQDLSAGENGAGNPTVLSINRSTVRAAAGFTSSSNTTITAGQDMTLFAASGAVIRRLSSNGTRLTRELRVLVDGAESAVPVVGGEYNRGDQGSQDCYDSAHVARGIMSVTNGQAITVSIDKSRDSGWNDGGGTPNTLAAEAPGIYLLNLGTV